MSQIADNLNAVNVYFHTIPAKTREGAAQVTDWVRWWEVTGNPSVYWISVPDTVWDEARNRKHAFDLANAITPAEVAQVKEVAKTGLSSEQMQGQADRRDPATGNYTLPPVPVIPSWVLPVAVGAGVLGVALLVLPRLVRRIINPVGL